MYIKCLNDKMVSAHGNGCTWEVGKNKRLLNILRPLEIGRYGYHFYKDVNQFIFRQMYIGDDVRYFECIPDNYISNKYSGCARSLTLTREISFDEIISIIDYDILDCGYCYKIYDPNILRIIYKAHKFESIINIIFNDHLPDDVIDDMFKNHKFEIINFIKKSDWVTSSFLNDKLINLFFKDYK